MSADKTIWIIADNKDRFNVSAPIRRLFFCANPRYIKKWSLSLFIMVLMVSPVYCQSSDNPVKNVFSDIGHISRSVVHTDKKSSLRIAGIAGAGLLIYSFDGQIRKVFSKNNTAWLDTVSKNAEKLGDGGVDMGILAGVALGGYAFKNEKLQKTAFLGAESFLVANFFGSLIKIAAGRARPYKNKGKKMFTPFTVKTSRTSLPSGHTITAFSIASVFAREYEGFWPDFAAYSLASAVGLQRIYSDRHWASDVFLGAVIGIAAGKTITRLSENENKKAVVFLPFAPSANGFGIRALIYF